MFIRLPLIGRIRPAVRQLSVQPHKDIEEERITLLNFRMKEKKKGQSNMASF
jgi:hypothetical protein